MNFSFGTHAHPVPESFRNWEQVRPQWKQVHGVAVARVVAAGQACGEVDALWTTDPALPIGVITADCVPIFLVHTDPKTQKENAVAAIHAGWKGTEQEIVRIFLETLPIEYANPGNWKAHIGPSIRACCYEFGSDLIDAFAKRFPEIDRAALEPVHRRLDLIAIHCALLEKLGISVASIHSDCTFCSKSSDGQPRYFSFRRGDRKSRMYSLIQL